MGVHIQQAGEYNMSAGSLVGTLGNLLFFGVFWAILGVAIDKIGTVFNRSITILPTFQDAVTGFTMVQQVYLVMPVIVFVVLIIDHILTENSNRSGEV
jgi:hypothetical protein